MIPHLGGGGAEQVTALLARGLSDSKYDIHLGLVTQEAAPFDAVPESVTVHALGSFRVRFGALGVLRLVRRIKPDVILSGMFHLNFMVLMLRPFFPAGTSVVVRQNSTVSASLRAGALPWYSGWLYRTLYRYADRVVCQSRAMADDLGAELGIAEERIAVLPNPIDFEGLESLAEPVPWPDQGPHILAVGRLAPEKGFDLLLRALAQVRRDFAHASLVIVGKGPELARLKALATELEIVDAVLFAGYVDRPAGFYVGADLFVMSSRHEGMPNAIIEAMASGLPIVATPASGGLVDLLSCSANAWLAKDVSVEGLVEALTQAINALEPRTLHWDHHRGERLARLLAFFNAAKFAHRKSSIAGIAAGPRSRRYAEFVGEFEFERAFEAYEALIDGVCARGNA